MSLLLGIDTATIGVSAALVRDGVTMVSFSTPSARLQTEILHPGIERLLESSGITIGDIDGVVVDVGPGRFTGVRVGLAAAKAFGFAAGVPVAGLVSTAILLEGARGITDDAVAVVDLRRGEIAVDFGTSAAEALVRTTPAELGAMLVMKGRTGALLVGDGAVEYEDAIAESTKCTLQIAGPDLMVPDVIAACGLANRIGFSSIALDPWAVQAIYLRGADVRLGWATRDAPSAPTQMEVG